jgi:hypothetical protein
MGINVHLPFPSFLSAPYSREDFAALRDETIVLRTQVTFLQSMLESKATRPGPYRTREVRKDAASYKSAKENTTAQLLAFVEGWV